MPPSEKIVLGFIGVGGMGTGLLNIFKEFPQVEIAAVCDVYEPHLRRAQSAAGGTARDVRRLSPGARPQGHRRRRHRHARPLARDHRPSWPARPARTSTARSRWRTASRKAGPWCTAAEKYKRVTQMGNLIHAGENYHRVVEIVRSGVLGKISKTRVWMAADRSGLGRPAGRSAPPPGCDYDFWLGPAPKRPFNPNRFTFNWRYFWDYGGGILTDFCCHIVDLVHWAMEVDAPGPSRPSAAATPSTTTPKCPTRSRSPTNTRRAARSS